MRTSPDTRKQFEIGSIARACFELILWAGARTCDAVSLGPENVGTDGILSFKPTKTTRLAYVPWTSKLPPWAQTWEAERRDMHTALEALSGGDTFLHAFGRVRSIKGLGNVINDGAKTAGLKKRTAHCLRKARLTAIAEAGGSAHAIMAWGGHKNLSEAQR